MKIEMKKFNEFCNKIIFEAKSKPNKRKKTKKKIIKESNTFNEHLEKLELNGKSYDINFIEFPDGKWNYQLNKKYERDCNLKDPSCDVWYPDLNEVEFEQNYNSYEQAKKEAINDILNQISWGQIL